MTKQEIRTHIKKLLAPYLQDREQVAYSSRLLVDRILQTEQWQSARHILLFSPLSDEINIAPLLTLSSREQQLYLPVVRTDLLEIHYYDSQATLHSGSFGILEPHESPILTSLTDIELAIIPAIGYTPAGDRLGRGKGYYDKLLTQIPNCYKIGVCYDLQIVAEIPTEPHDQPMDMILTPYYSWQRPL